MKTRYLALVFLVLLVSSSGPIAQQRVAFDAFEAFSIANPKGIGARDLNGDGILDIATCGDDYIAILLCNGDGTFQTAVKYYYQYDYDSFVSLVIDDFDDDGDADIAAACRSENAVVVFSNDGTGVFTAIGEYETLGYYPIGLCLSDFDGDGEDDIAIRYQNWDSMGWEYISVLLGNGDGTFQPAVHSTADGYVEISAFDPSDFDGDGDMDLAIAANLTDEVIILFGKGDGTFKTATHNCSYSSRGEGPVSISVSDFDLDDDADIVVLNGESCDFAILSNRGDGTFTGGGTYYPSYPTLCPDYIYCSDLDADGDTDLYCTDMGGDMRVFLGDGTGDFVQDVYYNIGGGSWCPELCSGDFDLDGDTDLVASSSVSMIAALMNNGDGTLRSPTYYSYNTCTQIYSSDLDGDGNADLVSIYSSNTRMAVFLGIGDGTVEHLIDYVVGPDASSVVIEDYNGDGTEDLAVANTTPHTVSIFLGNGDGTFQGKTDFPTGGASLQASAADFDGDGALDIALSNGYQRTVSILLGNGDGSFQAPESYPTTSYIKQPWGLCTSDFDGDGDNDIAVAGDSLYWDAKSLGVMMNNGDGTFQAPVRYRSEWRTRKLAAADIDRDGDDDIIAKYNYGIIVNRNNGDGTFQSWGIYSLSVGSFCVSDFNHDRNLDIVTVGESRSSPLRFLKGNGDGTFQVSQIFVTGFSGQDVCAPDLDGDGDPDIAAALYFELMTTLNLTPLATSAENESATPRSPLLSQNYPNPFNPVTTFRFRLPAASHVRIAVYDAAGRRVAVVADRFFQSGISEVVWDGRSERGEALASGVYFARMKVGDFTETRKLVLLR